MNQKVRVEQVIREAFSLWRASMMYNLMFSVFYFVLYFTFMFGLLTYTGVGHMLQETFPILLKNPDLYAKRVQAIVQTPEFVRFSIMNIICLGLIFPLQVGLLHLVHKVDNKKEVSVNDLFKGYSGFDFFKYSSFYILWMMISNSFAVLGILGVVIKIIWVMLTLFVVPLMFFKKEPMGTAFIWNFNVVKQNTLMVLLCVLLAGVFSALGFFVFLIGYALTFPFWISMIYTLYKYIFPNEIKTEN